MSWVLGRYDPDTQQKMDTAFGKAAEAAVAWVERGIDEAMRIGNQG